MTKKIAAIWAQDQEGLIGKDQVLPWSLPADLKHFKETTLGQALVMGRVTFEGMGQRALPHRTSLILTRDKNYRVDNEQVLVFTSVEDILDWFQKGEQDLYVIGGAQIFSAFEPYVDEVIKTEIQGVFEGDTYFPQEFDWSVFEEVRHQIYPKDEVNAHDFTVHVLKRKEK